MLSDKDNIDLRRIFVTSTMSTAPESRALVEMVKKLAKETLPFEELHETTAGSTLSCHCGSNALGILFFRKA